LGGSRTSGAEIRDQNGQSLVHQAVSMMLNVEQSWRVKPFPTSSNRRLGLLGESERCASLGLG
jgi:hypothetical protein